MKQALFSAIICTFAVTVKSSLTFGVMGDWGGSEIYPYTTQEEVTTAGGMGKVLSEENSSFALALGDNFYTHGIKNEFDSRFEHTFENVFTHEALQGEDFFRVLVGNHDHYGNVTGQVMYSNHSKRWRMDDLYYTFTEPVVLPNGSAGSLQLVMIDTVTLAGFGHFIAADGEMKSLHGNDLPGPKSQKEADDQMEWIESTLKESTADYLIVAGHYPVYSICEHGPTSTLVDNLKPLLEQYGVHAYMNGHDHCQEYIDENRGVQYHTIGSAHSNDPSTAHKDAIPEGSLKFHVGSTDKGGFGLVRVNSTGLTISHYTGDGNFLYEAPVISPRSH